MGPEVRPNDPRDHKGEGPPDPQNLVSTPGHLLLPGAVPSGTGKSDLRMEADREDGSGRSQYDYYTVHTGPETQVKDLSRSVSELSLRGSGPEPTLANLRPPEEVVPRSR